MRYSDDILLILPGGNDAASNAITFVRDEIRKHGDQLELKDDKTCVVQFNQDGANQNFRHLQGPQGKNGVEYLGFRFDGRQIYVRDSTRSRLYRKVAIAAKAAGWRHVSANPGLSIDELLKTFNYSIFSQKFSKVNKVDLSEDYKTWTFYSYLKRASLTFDEKGSPILGQMSGFKKFMRERIRISIEKASSREDRLSALTGTPSLAE